MTPDKDFSEFDGLDERTVRERIANGTYGPDRIKRAREWLSHQSELMSRTDRRDAIELARDANEAALEANEFAREANDLSRASNALASRANRAAYTAVTIANISAMIAITDIILRFSAPE